MPTDDVLDVIDLRPIVARNNFGNVAGIAFDPDAQVLALSYQRHTARLFVYSYFYPEGSEDAEARVLVIDPRTHEVASNVPIAFGNSIHIADDGLWQTFGEDLLRRYAGELPGEEFEDISVAASFPGLAAPGGITESFIGNLLLLDAAAAADRRRDQAAPARQLH